jgi:hypothetical protein
MDVTASASAMFLTIPHRLKSSEKPPISVWSDVPHCSVAFVASPRSRASQGRQLRTQLGDRLLGFGNLLAS